MICSCRVVFQLIHNANISCVSCVESLCALLPVGSRSADKLSFAGIEKGIAALGKKARDGTLSVDDMAGGTFTISNGGVYGSLLRRGTPPPPSACWLPALCSALALSISLPGRHVQVNRKSDALSPSCRACSHQRVSCSTPIVNPPQSAILGMHAIVERPVVVKGAIVARPIMNVALTYDHRIIDGREAVTFLKRIKDVVEHPERLLLDL